MVLSCDACDPMMYSCSQLSEVSYCDFLAIPLTFSVVVIPLSRLGDVEKEKSKGFLAGVHYSNL